MIDYIHSSGCIIVVTGEKRKENKMKTIDICGKEIKIIKKHKNFELEKLLEFITLSPYTLLACYKKHSVAKQEAFKLCREIHRELDDSKVLCKVEYGILSSNFCGFTYCGIFQKRGDNGNMETWVFHATYKNYCIFKA